MRKTVLVSATVALFGMATAGHAQFITNVDASNVDSFAGQGNANNTVLTVELAANAHVTGIGWDMILTTFLGSWASEATIAFGSTDEDFLFLAPGSGVNTGVINAPYTSGGILDLVDLELDFFVGADGVLRLEFFESFVDSQTEPDARWQAGSTIAVQWVPAPGAIALLGVAGLVGSRRRRA
jgi:hypothetical protein